MIKLKNILNESILIPRRSREDRLKFHRAHIYRKIRQYIKNGCKGDLDLYEAPIEYLPDELKYVGGYLNLSYSQITSLPNGLKVDGYLDLFNTPISSLPEGLEVGGDLDLSNTQIASLSNGLKVKKSLNLIETPLSRKYTREQIRQIIINKGGSIGEDIYL